MKKTLKTQEKTQNSSLKPKSRHFLKIIWRICVKNYKFYEKNMKKYVKIQEKTQNSRKKLKTQGENSKSRHF